ncbi:hypothetical protein HYW35_01085 [Candidatus Saccharibacteria bacterium]|nr:hypothetical protein [Candidatus Saccharibacteria bacterium]
MTGFWPYATMLHMCNQLISEVIIINPA